MAGHQRRAPQHPGTRRPHRRCAVRRHPSTAAGRTAPASRHHPAADRLYSAVAGPPRAQPLPLPADRRGRGLAGRRQQHPCLLHQPGPRQLPLRCGSRQRGRRLEYGAGQPHLQHRRHVRADGLVQAAVRCAGAGGAGGGRAHPQRPAGRAVPCPPAGTPRRTRAHCARPARHPAAGQPGTDPAPARHQPISADAGQRAHPAGIGNAAGRAQPRRRARAGQRPAGWSVRRP